MENSTSTFPCFEPNIGVRWKISPLYKGDRWKVFHLLLCYSYHAIGKTMQSKTAGKEAILLVEYEASQSSEEFHSGLIWSVSNFLWAISTLLFGFILANLSCTVSLSHQILLTGLSILGILLILFSWIFALQFNSITNQKYQRCKEIEKLLGMSQHTNLKYKNFSQRFLYWIIIKLFILCWIVTIVYIWKN